MTEEEFERNVGGVSRSGDDAVSFSLTALCQMLLIVFKPVNVAAWMFAFSRARHFEDSTEVAFYGLISKWAFPPVITTYFVL